MSVIVPESELPTDLSTDQAVEAAYVNELAVIAQKVHRGLPALIECDKELAPYVYANVRQRLRALGWQCLYIDGRPRPQPQPQTQTQTQAPANANPPSQPNSKIPPPPSSTAPPAPGMFGGGANAGAAGQMPPASVTGTMLQQLRDAVRGAVDQRVVVLPHLDILATNQGGLTTESREVILLLYENPDIRWIGFKDPSFPLPSVIENLFPHRTSLLGVPRNRVRHLVTQREARKFGAAFNPWTLYKYISGINAVRLRRLLSALEGEDYPQDTKHIYKQMRQATLTGTLEVPDADLERDLGGYAKVKRRLRLEILDVLQQRDRLTEENAIRRLEDLIPKGMIFWGPPGTGKTLFAKAMASALGAAITIVSGPELKSKWVGESEDNLRRIFRSARQSAPSIIVFDELDSFATARGTYAGSGVEHSMINQLLTEMDGFHKEELVFVVGTTNFVESLDHALLRPGRFEFQLHIPYPDTEDRREIFNIYNKSMNLEMTADALEQAVKHTGDYVPGSSPPSRHSGDHINALCRAISRIRLRESRDAPDVPTTPEDVERAMSEWIELPDMTPAEEIVVATHEVGHAVCSLFCKHSPPIERITIRGNYSGALGFVRYQEKAHRYVITRGQLLDDLCVLMGGREAELLLLDDLSIGSSDDLRRASEIARALITEFGMGSDELGPRRFLSESHTRRDPPDHLSANVRDRIDAEISDLLREASHNAKRILQENLPMLQAMRTLLLEKKTIDARNLTGFLADNPSPNANVNVNVKNPPASPQ